MKKMRNANVTLTAAALAAVLLSLVPVHGGAHQPPAHKKEKKTNVVYVCTCLQTKSCSCMTEAKTEGPCSCGTAGGPPMKAVASDSDWAKENRDELAK